jgi:hypothetical protein
MPRANTLEDLWPKISKQDCWLWTGNITPTGYGTFGWKRQIWLVHALVYQLVVGQIPAGTELHHKCQNRHCCNPKHLEPLTRKEHRKTYPRLPTNGNEKKTHCLRGHAFTEENTIHRHGSRICKACEKYPGRSGYLKRKYANNP